MSGGTFLYAPEITVRIRTAKGEIFDVSDDISRATVRRATGISSASVTLTNAGRKWDNVFSPQDQIVIYLRRTHRMLVFSGYLNQVPLFQTYPGSVTLTASCTLKRLQYWYWDPSTQAAQEIIGRLVGESDLEGEAQDGGLSQRAVEVLTRVVGWNKKQIHIGAIPSNWKEKIVRVGESIVDEAERWSAINDVSGGAMRGVSPFLGGKRRVKPLAGEEDKTGFLPTSSGRVTAFGGASSSRVGTMELTGEPRKLPDSQRGRWGGEYYVQMRWPYQSSPQTSTKQQGDVGVWKASGAVPEDVSIKRSQQWWSRRRLLVVNEKTGKAVVVRCADWGPNESTGKAIGLSSAAMKAISAKNNDHIRVSFAEDNATLGPVTSKSKNIDPQIANAVATFGQSATKLNPMSSTGYPPPSSPGMKQSGQKLDANTVYNHCLRAGFSPENARIMTAIAYGESGHDLNILGDTTIQTSTWGPSVGLFQIRTLHADKGTGRDRDINALLGNATRQAQAAYNIWKERGNFTAWSVYTSGKYKQYLGGNFAQMGGALTGSGAGSGSVGSQADAFTAMAETILDFKPKYVYGAQPKSSDATPSSFDCSSLVQWAAARIGFTGLPRVAVDQKAACDPIPVEEALQTRGALLFIHDGGRGTTSRSSEYVGVSHVAISRGDGRTIEARNSKSGTGSFDGSRGFHSAGLIRGMDYTGSFAGMGGTSNNINKDNFADALINASDWLDQNSDTQGDTLAGIRRLMNDVPVYETVESLLQSSMREWCSAPNGDLIAWFPDYFGHYGTAAKMVVQDIEIMEPFSVVWSDDRLKTHVYTSSATAGGLVDAAKNFDLTAGVATVEQNELMHAILSLDDKDFRDQGKAFLRQFGARPEVHAMNSITGPWQEFYFAVHHFAKQWSQQYSANVGLTFMPELWPGMLAVFPTWWVQAYVSEVSHEIDLGPSGGFSTSVSLTAWSTVGGKKSPFKGFPKGGPL